MLGLVVNLVAFALLRAGAKESLNVRGAYLEVLSDTLGSVAVVIGAIVWGITGWTWVDPMIGAAIGLFILPRAWRLGGEAVRILVQAAPAGHRRRTRSARTWPAIPGVVDVHDLHVWTLTSEMEVASAHLMVRGRYRHARRARPGPRAAGGTPRPRPRHPPGRARRPPGLRRAHLVAGTARRQAVASSTVSDRFAATTTRQRTAPPPGREPQMPSTQPSKPSAGPRISHLVLTVRDIDASERFYTEVLGFERCGVLEGPLALSEMRFFRAGESHHDLALVQVGKPDEVPAPPDEWEGFFPAHAVGINHFAVAYPDRETWMAQLAHLQASGVPFDLRGNHGMTHSVYVRDPDGHSVEVLYDLPSEVWEGDVNAALNHFEMLPSDGPESLVDDTDYERFEPPRG